MTGWRAPLEQHAAALQVLLRRRVPQRFDTSVPAAELKKAVQSWNRQALLLIREAPQGEKSAEDFRALGNMRFTTLDEVKAQLKQRGQIVVTLLQRGRKKTAPTKNGSVKVRKPRNRTYKYDFCLSFAGADREFATAVNRALRKKRYVTFFDTNKDASTRLLGQYGNEVLHEVFYRESRLCILFISGTHAENAWTNHERRAAQARELEQGGEYIIPVRLDETRLPGFNPTIGYLQKRQGVEKIVSAVSDKLKEVKAKSAPKRPKVKSTPATARKPAKRKTTAGNHLILLDQQVYKAQQVKRGDHVEVSIRSKNPQELGQLRGLKAIKGQWATVRFAEQLTGADARVLEYGEVTDQLGHTVVTVSLSLSEHQPARPAFSRSIESQQFIRQLLTGHPGSSNWVSLPTEVRKGVPALADRQGLSIPAKAMLAQLLATYYLGTLQLAQSISQLTFRARGKRVTVEFSGHLWGDFYSQAGELFSMKEEVFFENR